MSEKDPQVRIEYVALSSVQPATRNPKRHNIGELVNSIKRFGFVQPVAMNEESGRLVAGHGRLEALLVMKEAGEAAPARVVEKNGEWYVPVLRGISFNNESEAEAFLVADNRLVEVGGWNEVEVARILQGLGDLSGVGFSGVDLEALVAFGATGESVLGGMGESLPNALPDMNEFPSADKRPRLIIVCETMDQQKKVRERLGLKETVGGIIYRFSDIVW